MRLELQVLDTEHKLNRSVRDHATQLFGKLDRFLPDTASRIDLRLDHIHHGRKGKTHYVHVAVAIPKEPRTFHVEVLAEDFRTALDRLYKKTERYLRKRHEKRIQRHRSAERKAQVNDWVHATLSAPKRLLERIARKRRSEA
ncbi:HPF/RaiA family ribosome-associated protein [Candidatus Berkelbacteria bacterium]|nr:HPF/RaiA family ribosome-associated protein [Candidatus Berkelbacteria bacterium]